jgi:hypothetical protein
MREDLVGARGGAGLAITHKAWPINRTRPTNDPDHKKIILASGQGHILGRFGCLLINVKNSAYQGERFCHVSVKRSKTRILLMGALDISLTRTASMVSSQDASGERRTLRRFVVDFAAALCVFSVFAGLFSIGASNAFPIPPPPELSLASSLMPPPAMITAIPTFPGVAEGPSMLQTLTLLAFAFASLVATNLAIGRHLLAAYATPRRKT